jgi:hypothetical protein
VKAATGVLLMAIGVLVGAWFWASPLHTTFYRPTLRSPGGAFLPATRFSVRCFDLTPLHDVAAPDDVVVSGPEILNGPDDCHKRAVERVITGASAGTVFIVLGVVILLGEISKRRDQLRWWFGKKLWPDRTVWTVFLAVAVGWSGWMIGQGLGLRA